MPAARFDARSRGAAHLDRARCRAWCSRRSAASSLPPTDRSAICALAFPENFYFDQAAPEVAQQCMPRQHGCGAKIVPVRVPDVDCAQHCQPRIILLCEASAVWGPWLDRRELFGADVLALLDQGRLVAGTDYVNAQRLRRSLRPRIRRAIRDDRLPGDAHHADHRAPDRRNDAPTGRQGPRRANRHHQPGPRNQRRGLARNLRALRGGRTRACPSVCSWWQGVVTSRCYCEPPPRCSDAIAATGKATVTKRWMRPRSQWPGPEL